MVDNIEVVRVSTAGCRPSSLLLSGRSIAYSDDNICSQRARTRCKAIVTRKTANRSVSRASCRPARDGCGRHSSEGTRQTKKVITNDDLKGGGLGSGFSPADFSLINNCNRACFEQVRQQAHIIPSTNPNWKHDLLQAIEQVRKDDDWQKYLRDLYEVRLKFCSLGNEKRDELARYTDPNNVTPRELAIDEKYDAKFTAAQNELRALDAREAALQRKYAGSPLAYQFMMIQMSRIQSANCYSQSYSPTDANDP